MFPSEKERRSENTAMAPCFYSLRHGVKEDGGNGGKTNINAHWENMQ